MTPKRRVSRKRPFKGASGKPGVGMRGVTLTGDVRGFVIPLTGDPYSVTVERDVNRQLVDCQRLVGGFIAFTLVGTGRSTVYLMHHEDHTEMPRNDLASEFCQTAGLNVALGGTVVVFGFDARDEITDCPEDTALAIQLLREG